MLQAMKSKAGTWVIRIFAVLLIFSFAAWGIGDMLTGGGLPTEVADVGDTKITANEFNERFRREMDRLRSVLGSQLDSEQARQFGIADNALEVLISQRLLMLEAEQLGLAVGDDQVRAAIERQTAFRNSRGQFDQAVYQQVLQQSGFTTGRYEEGMRSELTQSHLTGVISSASLAPAYVVDQLYRYRNEKRIAELVVVTRASIKAPPDPSDSELLEFHRKNSTMFTAPEMRDLTAIHLSPAKLAEEISPSEEQLKDEYESRLSSLSIPERRRLRQILTRDETTARHALDRLRQGEDIAKVAKEVAGQDAEVTRLGLVTFEDLPSELAEVAFKLNENKPSEPVRSPLGWHVLIVEKIEAGKTPTFAEVRDKITKDVARELAVDGLVKLANRLEDALAGGASVEEAASQINTRVIKAYSIDAAGRTANGTAAKNLPKSVQFLETAFSTGQGENSDLSETPEGGYFIVRVDRVIPPSIKPFSKVRNNVARAWERDRRDTAAREKAEAILGEVKAGASLASVAGKNRLKLETSKEFTRYSRAAGSRISSPLAAGLFRVDRGGAAMAPTRDGYAVARVKDIRAADPSADKTGIEGLRKQIGSTMGSDLLAQFSDALRERYPVNIDRGAMDRLFNASPALR